MSDETTPGLRPATGLLDQGQGFRDTLSTLGSAAGNTAEAPSELAQILDAAAVDHADRCAIRSEAGELTYRRLHEDVTAVADRLRANGIRRGDAVGVHLPRSAAALIAIHAVIATGAVVAPLDVNDPPERMQSLLQQAGISYLLVPQNSPASAPVGESLAADVGAGLALVHSDTSDRTGIPERRTTRYSEPGYLLFTSGSTGVPKGVLLPSSAVVHFARWAARSLQLRAEDRVAAQAALTFDLSTFDIFSTAAVGAAVVILPEWLKAFPGDTVDWLAANEISTIYAVPTLLKGIVAAVAAGKVSLPHLRAVVFAGEPYPGPALGDLLSTFPDVEVRNWFGPTETNVCTAADVRSWRPGTPVPIGRPISGVQACIVDDDLNQADVGELVIAGPTLLSGYVVDGTVVDPSVEVTFPDGQVRRAYRTGDHAFRDDAGELVLKGRADRQIKRRGYRIDLTGIEAIASDVGSAPGAVAVATGADKRITLFVDVDPAAPSSAAVIEAVDHALRSRLPSTSQPDRIVARSPLPTNRRGKVDRALLEDLATESLTDQEKHP